MNARSDKPATWLTLTEELDAWRRKGLTANFWSRDDDAIALSPQLDRLIALAKAARIEIGLAVIPARLTDALAEYLHSDDAPFYPMCHGWRHVNYGAPQSPSEFGPERPLPLLVEDAKSAFESFSARFGSMRAVFVPPFARISSALVPELSGIGFYGVSTGPTPAERRYARLTAHFGGVLPAWRAPVGRAMHYDVHIDPFNWKAGRARPSRAIERELVGYLRARRLGYVPMTWPIGVLLHHLAFDDETWSVCHEMLQVLSDHPAVTWPTVAKLVESGSTGGRPAEGAAQAHEAAGAGLEN